MAVQKTREIVAGDRIRLKKKHPCGSCEWDVLRVGTDFKLCCAGCGRTLMIPRHVLEKSIVNK